MKLVRDMLDGSGLLASKQTFTRLAKFFSFFVSSVYRFCAVVYHAPLPASCTFSSFSAVTKCFDSMNHSLESCLEFFKVHALPLQFNSVLLQFDTSTEMLIWRFS